MIQGRIDTSFQTLQRDLFASGLVADIGMNAFGVWLAIKSHSDFNTGESWPGMRRLAALTGLSVGSVQKGVKRLVEAKLLRIAKLAKGSNSRRGNTYVARERMDVRLGDRVLCTIVLDYVPVGFRDRIKSIESGLRKGKNVGEVLADCEIIPGVGFAWDGAAGVLRAAIPAQDIPPGDLTDEQLKAPIVQRVIAMRKAAAGK